MIGERVIQTILLVITLIIFAILIDEWKACDGSLVRTLFWVECIK